MISKVTMYDGLAIVGPGTAILFLLSSLCQRAGVVLEDALELYYDLDTALQLALLTLLSYLIGLLWHKMSECVFVAWRNDEAEIEECRHLVIKEIISREKGHSCPTTGQSCPWIAQSCLLFGQQCPLTSRCYPLVSRSYYSAYYNLMSKDKLGSVPVLEAQVAFLRNCILIIPIATVWLYNNELTPCWSSIFLLGGLILLFWIMRRIQKKIYLLVWEGNAYIP